MGKLLLLTSSFKINLHSKNVEEFKQSDEQAVNLIQHTKSEIKTIKYNLERSIKGHDVYIELNQLEPTEIQAL